MRAVHVQLIAFLTAHAYALRANIDRRQFVASTLFCASSHYTVATEAAEAAEVKTDALLAITDPSTYSALMYAPPCSNGRKLPLLVVLHGAGINEAPIWSLADSNGEHAGLVPSLLASGRAPAELADNFAVVAPYAQGKRSFYEEPRRKLLDFVAWVSSPAGRAAGCPEIDTSRIFLFGFSDGATVGVELATTRRFAGGVIAAYGFTGELPSLALERLSGVPLWIFHSADDVIFPVASSDRLVRSLRHASSSAGGRDVVRYTRFDRDQEGFTGRVRGHSTGITASKDPQVFEWLLSL